MEESFIIKDGKESFTDKISHSTVIMLIVLEVSVSANARPDMVFN